VSGIVDGHCHAWRRWPYAPPQVPDPDSRGRVEQLLFEMDRHGIDQAILVCARLPGNDDNVDYALDAAARHPGRIHAFPDLDCSWSPTYHRPGAADRLRAMLDRTPVRGITHYLAPENDGWLRSREADELFRVACERELIVSLSAPPPWLADVGRIAARFPAIPVLCHHLGLCATAEQLGELVRLADVANLLVKVSGFSHLAERPWDFPFERQLEMVRRLYEVLGPERLCWGSDFPVCLEHITYRQALEAFRTHCGFVGERDRELILGQTLARLLAARVD
jgi:L-fuconolactonase